MLKHGIGWGRRAPAVSSRLGCVPVEGQVRPARVNNKKTAGAFVARPAVCDFNRIRGTQAADFIPQIFI
jgi:hypothetical protein